jgi:hypothetical protein
MPLVVTFKSAERDAAEEHQGIAFGCDQVIERGADHQSQTDAHGKRHGQSGDRYRRHQQDVGDVEDDPAQKRVNNVALVRRGQVLEKAVGAGGVGAAQRHTDQQRAEQNAPDVIPIEEFKAPILAEFLRVGPASPAEHAEHHHHQRHGVNLGDEHECTFSKS